jgi:hypothetical protein
MLGIEEIRNMYKILVLKPDVNKPRATGNIWEYNIKATVNEL